MIPTNKNIAVLHPYVNKLGGAVMMMIFLSNYLKVKNNLIFYTFSYDKNLYSNEKINFQIKSFFGNGILKFISFFLIAFKIRKSDFIIVGNSPMHFVGVLSKLLFFSKAKIIWWNHHYPWYYRSNANLFIRLKGYIEKHIVKKIDIVLSNSKGVKNFVDNIWNINSKILNPVLDEEFYKNKNKISKDNKKIIFTYGRRVEGKNLQLVFKTYEKLKNEINDLILIVGGDGSELQKYKKKYKNNLNVKIVGSLVKNQILKNLNKSTVFLFPSLIDSFGLVKIEAMSTGNPIICLKGIQEEEIVNNGINGFCVKSENDFINKTNLVLNNSDLRKKLSKNSIQTSKGYSISNFEKQMNNIFIV